MAKKKKVAAGNILPPKNKSQYIKMVRKGQSYYNKGDYNFALKLFTASWKYDTSNQTVIKLVADCLFHLGNRNVAINLLAYVLEKNPNDTAVITILGNAALKMELFDLAKKIHQLHIQISPEDPVGYNNYASALREDGKLDDAITFLKDILPMFPTDENLWNTLGSIVAFRDGGAESIVFYEECLRINPNNAMALNNIAPPYLSVGDVEKAEWAIRKGIEISPRLSKLHLFLSTLLLSSKRMEEGWKEYQWRKDGGNILGTIAYNKIPPWQGEDLTGKKIFVFGEQGVGDEMLFSWLFNEITEEAGRVRFACTPRLHPLFENSFKNATVGTYLDRFDSKLDFELKIFPNTDLREFDYMCCSGDLAMYKWNQYEDIKPSSDPILIPSEEKVAHWKEILDELPHDISVGIAWRSGIRHAKRARNYATLLDWEPILKQKNINFINVQYGDCAEELEELERETGIKINTLDDLDLKDDFDGTTAMMQSLDLVIGPSAAPIMQSALSGVQTWYLTTGLPWWAFGEATPIWRQNAHVFDKNDNILWEDFMKDRGEDFKKWLKTVKK